MARGSHRSLNHHANCSLWAPKAQDLAAKTHMPAHNQLLLPAVLPPLLLLLPAVLLATPPYTGLASGPFSAFKRCLIVPKASLTAGRPSTSGKALAAATSAACSPLVSLPLPPSLLPPRGDTGGLLLTAAAGVASCSAAAAVSTLTAAATSES